MYEDSWYSFVPGVHGKQDDGHQQKSQHRRRESLLKQPTVRTPLGVSGVNC
jgi:conserved oligomeric Golgi complex subunit 3